MTQMKKIYIKFQLNYKKKIKIRNTKVYTRLLFFVLFFFFVCQIRSYIFVCFFTLLTSSINVQYMSR